MENNFNHHRALSHPDSWCYTKGCWLESVWNIKWNSLVQPALNTLSWQHVLLPLRDWGTGNAYLLVLSKPKMIWTKYSFLHLSAQYCFWSYLEGRARCKGVRYLTRAPRPPRPLHPPGSNPFAPVAHNVLYWSLEGRFLCVFKVGCLEAIWNG